MQLGVCYYPEQWPEDRWAEDARLMVEAGIEYVRIAEFAWAVYEPERNRFAWGWLDRAVATLSDAGLKIIMGTPTATPPIWLAIERPDILRVDAAGHRLPYGGRRHTCPTSAAYRKESMRVTRALVDRYGAHEAIVAWQIDNEPGNHDSARCWCDECAAAFTIWLRDRYQTVEALNTAWGTMFWSQVYPDFEAVRLPRPAATEHSPSLRLAHLRFATTQVVSGLAAQHGIIAAGSVGRDITVNFYAGDTFVDYRKVGRITGIGAIDSYPHGAADPAEVRFWHDLARGLGGNGRGWIMEQQPGAINWTTHNPPVPDGQVAQWLNDAADDGIERTLLFRWRAALYGQEQYHSGLLRHDATLDRGYDEVSIVSRQQRPEPPAATAAVLYDYEDAWAWEIEPHQLGLTHRKIVVNAHAAVRSAGYITDVVGFDDDLSPYSLIVAPGALLAAPGKAEALLAAATAGAEVIIGPRSLTRTIESTALPTAIPDGISDKLDICLVEGLSQTMDVTFGDDGPTAGRWTDVFDGASGIAHIPYGGGTHLDGQPAAMRVSFGAGTITVMGASSTAAWTALLSDRFGLGNKT